MGKAKLEVGVFLKFAWEDFENVSPQLQGRSGNLISNFFLYNSSRQLLPLSMTVPESHDDVNILRRIFGYFSSSKWLRLSLSITAQTAFFTLHFHSDLVQPIEQYSMRSPAQQKSHGLWPTSEPKDSNFHIRFPTCPWGTISGCGEVSKSSVPGMKSSQPVTALYSLNCT